MALIGARGDRQGGTPAGQQAMMAFNPLALALTVVLVAGCATTDTADVFPMNAAAEQLGPVQCGAWEVDAAGRLDLIGHAPKKPGVYLYVVDGAVKYVGSARENLDRRTRRYVGRVRAADLRLVHAGIIKAT